MSKLTDKQKEHLIKWVKSIYNEVDDEEFPDLLIDQCYEYALQNNEVPEEFLPETMPFGKYRGEKICGIGRGYIEVLLMHKSKQMHPLLVRSLKNRLLEIDCMEEYMSSTDDEYYVPGEDLEEDWTRSNIPNTY